MGVIFLFISIYDLNSRFELSSVHYLKLENFEVRNLQVGKPTFDCECLRPTYLLLRAQTATASLAPSVRRNLYHV